MKKEQIAKLKELEAKSAGLVESYEDLTKRAEKMHTTASLRKSAFLDEDGYPFGTGRLFNEDGKPIDEECLYKADDIHIVATLLNKDPRELALFAQYTSEITELRKALDTQTATGGAQWVPTGFSPILVDKVRTEYKIAGLFEEFNMPQDPYILPVAGNDATVYIVPATRGDDATQLKKSTPTTPKVTFSTTELAVDVVINSDYEEDSIIPILPWIRNLIITSIAKGMDQSVLDGDTTATHKDSDVVDPKDVRKAWLGLRKIATLPSSPSSVDCSTFSNANVRAIRTEMAKYGVNPADLAWIVGIKSYNKFLNSLTDVQTIDKFGPKATILTGELAKFDGIPLIVSDLIRENLNDSGSYDASTTDKTIILLVHRPSFKIGIRRAIKFFLYPTPLTSQMHAIASFRRDLQPLYATATEQMVGEGIKIS